MVWVGDGERGVRGGGGGGGEEGVDAVSKTAVSSLDYVNLTQKYCQVQHELPKHIIIFETDQLKSV